MTMGPPQAEEALRMTLALGADRCIHLSDRVFALADTLGTSRTLALALRTLEGYPLVDPIGDVHQKGLGGDMRPFEVWIYEGDIPLPPDADPSVSENRRYRKLVFLFVDEQGLGDYRLRYSTE